MIERPSRRDELGAALDAPVIKGSTKNKEREVLFDRFRRGEIPVLVVSKVANFSIDLPEAAVAVRSASGLEPREVLDAISHAAHELMDQHAYAFHEVIRPALREEGIRILRPDQLT